MDSRKTTIASAVAIIALGVAWLLNNVGVLPAVEWVWTLGLAVTGILIVAIGGLDKATGVVGAAGDRRGTAAWSAIGTAVALGNSLAYAWNVPVVGLPLAGDEKFAEVEEAVRKVAARPRKGAWLKAAYSGEPNITKAKPVF